MPGPDQAGGRGPEIPAPRRRRRLLWIGLPILLVLAGSVAWILLPYRLGPLRVDEVQMLPASGEAGPAGGQSRIAVTFRVPRDLAELRALTGLGYVAARLADCRNVERHQDRVVAQRAEYLREDGRVTKLNAGPDGWLRYRAVFDDALAETVAHESQRTPARTSPGGLCLSLYGASPWFGHGRSDSVPLGLPSE